jgi:hypothetical protein
VNSRPRDGRDAEVRSLELLRTAAIFENGQRLSGTVVSYDRRGRLLVMQADNGRTFNVDLRSAGSDGFRRGDRINVGDRISIMGRMDRGTVLADDIRMGNDRREHDGHRH